MRLLAKLSKNNWLRIHQSRQNKFHGVLVAVMVIHVNLPYIEIHIVY